MFDIIKKTLGLPQDLVKYYMREKAVTYGNQVTPLTGGKTYIQTVGEQLELTTIQDPKNSFIYLAGWWLDPQLQVNGRKLTDVLKEKSRQGVDVRVLGWVMPYTTVSNYAIQSGNYKPMAEVNYDTVSFINELRQEATLANKVCLNVLSHPAGAVHMKMLVMGNKKWSVGFTGGIDLQLARTRNWWHDVGVQVKGPATQGFFDLFRLLWNENRRRPVQRFILDQLKKDDLILPSIACDSHLLDTLELPKSRIACPAEGKWYVDGLATIPQFNFPALGNLAATINPRTFPTNLPLTEAPSGQFEIKEAWQKGISAARHYIYIEDQAFWSTEVFDWVNQAIKNNQDLRVVLLTGRADPNDEPNTGASKFLSVAINNHLLKDLTKEQIARIGYFNHQEKVIHSKVTIVDDVWMMIGSANCMRRSLYTDFEHGVALMDPEDQTVPEYRSNLWLTHLSPNGEQKLQKGDMDEWFSAWFKLPGQEKATQMTPVVRVQLPLPPAQLDSKELILYNEVFDADSTKTWGSGVANLAVSEVLATQGSRKDE